jgi:hypothetical protein
MKIISRNVFALFNGTVRKAAAGNRTGGSAFVFTGQSLFMRLLPQSASKLKTLKKLNLERSPPK